MKRMKEEKAEQMLAFTNKVKVIVLAKPTIVCLYSQQLYAFIANICKPVKKTGQKPCLVRQDFCLVRQKL